MKNYYANRESHNAIPELTTVLNQSSEVIRQFITTSAIYCFASKTETATMLNAFGNESGKTATSHHIYLLVFTEETKINATADLADLIAGTIPNCRATLLLHKTTSLRHLTANQKWCFKHMVDNSIDVYVNNTSPPYLHLDKEPVRKPEWSRAYWNDRLRIANTYLESERQMEVWGMECVQHSMLHVAVEQVCLGIIEVVLGYHPNHYALNYLLDLCSICTTLPNEIFPRTTEEDQLLYRLLTTNFHTLRHAKCNFHGFTYTELLSKRCSEFIERAQIEMANELERITIV